MCFNSDMNLLEKKKYYHVQNNFLPNIALDQELNERVNHLIIKIKMKTKIFPLLFWMDIRFLKYGSYLAKYKLCISMGLFFSNVLDHSSQLHIFYSFPNPEEQS